MTFQELESESARLRAALAELRTLYLEEAKKFAKVSALLGIDPSQPAETLLEEIRVKLATVPALNGHSVETAARWLEDYWRAIAKASKISLAGTPYDEKSATSWTTYGHDAQLLIDALRKR